MEVEADPHQPLLEGRVSAALGARAAVEEELALQHRPERPGSLLEVARARGCPGGRARATRAPTVPGTFLTAAARRSPARPRRAAPPWSHPGRGPRAAERELLAEQQQRLHGAAVELPDASASTTSRWKEQQLDLRRRDGWELEQSGRAR